MDGTALWVPRSVPQWAAVLSPADELFYGGAAGGGKTDLSLALGLFAHRRAIIFRREYTQFRDVIDRGNELLSHLGISFNALRARWELPNGAWLELGAVDHPKDLNKYKGRPHDLIAIDEAADMPEWWVRFLSAWKRTTDPNQRTRTLLCGNPPTDSQGEWIIQYFAPWLDEDHPNPAKPGELRWFVAMDGKDHEVEGPEPVAHKGESLQPISRSFIPALLKDNPFLRNTGYEGVLQALPEPLRSKLLFGDFGAAAIPNPWQVIPTEWVKLAQARYKRGKRPDLALRAVGLDVSRGGKDHTVAARLYHEWFETDAWPGVEIKDGPAAADRTIALLMNDGPAPIGVDVIGWGSSAFDFLVFHGMDAYPVNVSDGTTETDSTGKFRFANIRALMHWRMREALDPNGPHAIALPPGRRIRTDLCAARYTVIKSGIKIESKEAIVDRLKYSPDWGDAIMLAWYIAHHSAPGISFS